MTTFESKLDLSGLNKKERKKVDKLNDELIGIELIGNNHINQINIMSDMWEMQHEITKMTNNAIESEEDSEKKNAMIEYQKKQREMHLDFTKGLLSAFAVQSDMLRSLYGKNDNEASYQELEEQKQMVRDAKRKPTLGSFIKIDETKTTTQRKNETSSPQKNKKLNKKQTTKLPDINNENDFPSLNSKSSNKKK
jgi:primosomal protein N'